jgi:uncharacterized protein YjiS (DUF1127 family)
MLRTHTISVGELRSHRETTLQRLETVAHLWLRRRRTRRALAALNDYELRDIGITRDDARRETGKPFWSPWLRP